MNSDFQLHDVGPRGVCIPAGEHSVECAHEYLMFLDGVATNAPTLGEIRNNQRFHPAARPRNDKIKAFVLLLEQIACIYPDCSIGYDDETERYVVELDNHNIVDIVRYGFAELQGISKYAAEDVLRMYCANSAVYGVEIIADGPYIEPCMNIQFRGYTKIVVEIDKKELPV